MWRLKRDLQGLPDPPYEYEGNRVITHQGCGILGSIDLHGEEGLMERILDSLEPDELGVCHFGHSYARSGSLVMRSTLAFCFW